VLLLRAGGSRAAPGRGSAPAGTSTERQRRGAPKLIWWALCMEERRPRKKMTGIGAPVVDSTREELKWIGGDPMMQCM